MRISLFLLFMVSALHTFGQGGWIRRADVPPGAGRSNASGAAVGNKGYLLGGADRYNTYRKDVLEYDPATDTWREVGNVPGYGRAFANAYSQGGNIYFGLGLCQFTNSIGCTQSINRYDPVSDTFGTPTSFIGCPRWVSAGFTIDNDKLYVCGGQSSHNFCTIDRYRDLPDLWEYNITTDTWTQKASLPEYRAAPTGFSLNNKGYIVGGGHNGIITSDVVAYDPVTDTWETRAPLPVPNQYGASFVLNNEAYVLSGRLQDKSIFFKYDEQKDTWLPAPEFPGRSRQGSACFSINGKGYIVGGVTFADGSSDTWEYNPSCPANIENRLSVIYSVDTPFCYVAQIDTIKGDSVQYAQASYTWLQSTDGLTYQTIPNSNNYYISNLTLTQSTYFKRVAYCNTDCFDTAPPIKITVSTIDTTMYITPSSFVCRGDTIKLANYHQGKYKHWTIDGEIVYYNWSPGVRVPYRFDTLLATRSGIYKVFNINEEGCADSTEVNVTILSLDKKIRFTPSLLCLGDSVSIANDERGEKRWYRNDTLLLTGQNQPFDADSFTTHLTGTYWLTIERDGCRDTSSKYRIGHLPQPEPTITRQENYLFTASGYQSYAWFDDQHNLTGDSDSHFYPEKSGSYYVVVTNRYGCTGISDIFPFEKEEPEQSRVSLSDFRSQLAVFPNPAEDIFIVTGSRISGKEITLSLFNMQGQLIHRRLISIRDNHFSYRLDLSEMPSGNYMLQLQSGAWQTSKKIEKL